MGSRPAWGGFNVKHDAVFTFVADSFLSVLFVSVPIKLGISADFANLKNARPLTFFGGCPVRSRPSTQRGPTRWSESAFGSVAGLARSRRKRLARANSGVRHGPTRVPLGHLGGAEYSSFFFAFCEISTRRVTRGDGLVLE